MSRIVLSVWLGLSLTAVGSAQPPKEKLESVKLTARASNDFACDLFRELAKSP